MYVYYDSCVYAVEETRKIIGSMSGDAILSDNVSIILLFFSQQSTNLRMLQTKIVFCLQAYREIISDFPPSFRRNLTLSPLVVN